MRNADIIEGLATARLAVMLTTEHDQGETPRLVTSAAASNYKYRLDGDLTLCYSEGNKHVYQLEFNGRAMT
jgi:hypothetical protein